MLGLIIVLELMFLLLIAYLWWYKKDKIVKFETKVKRHFALKWMAEQGYVIKKIGDNENV